MFFPERRDLLWCGCQVSSKSQGAYQKLEGAQVRQLGGSRIEVCPTRAGESVVLLGVVVQRHVCMPVQGLMQLCLRRWRAELVLGRDVQQRWATDSGGLSEGVFNTNPIIAHGAVRVMACRQQVCQLAAQTKTDAT